MFTASIFARVAGGLDLAAKRAAQRGSAEELKALAAELSRAQAAVALIYAGKFGKER